MPDRVHTREHRVQPSPHLEPRYRISAQSGCVKLPVVHEPALGGRHPPNRLLPDAIHLQNVENLHWPAGSSTGCRWGATNVENRRLRWGFSTEWLEFGSVHPVRIARHGHARGRATASHTQLARAVTSPPQNLDKPPIGSERGRGG